MVNYPFSWRPPPTLRCPSQTWSQGVWGLNAHSAPYSSKPWASCFSLWASVSSSEIPGSTPQNRENRIVTTIGETREGQWLPEVTLQESGKHSGVLASQPQTPSTPSSLPWSGSQVLGPASCWRPGLYNLAAGIPDLRNNRPSACSGLGPGPPLAVSLA